MDFDSYLDQALFEQTDLLELTERLLFELRRTDLYDITIALHDLADELIEAVEERDVDWWSDVVEAMAEYFTPLDDIFLEAA